MNTLAGTQLNIVGNKALVTYVDASMEGLRDNKMRPSLKEKTDGKRNNGSDRS